jgi:hypothetical protein
VDRDTHTMQWVSPPCLTDRVRAALENMNS